MDAREYLKQYKHANGTLKRLQEKRYEKEMTIGGGGINYDGMPKGNLKTSRVEREAIELTELQRKIDVICERAELVKKQIQLDIEKLPKADYKNVLTAIYIDSHPKDPRSIDHPTEIEYASQMIRYSYSHTKRLHYEALREMEKIIGN